MAKRKKYRRICGYNGPTKATLTKGHISTAGKLDAPSTLIWRDPIPFNGPAVYDYKKTHHLANIWLRDNASGLGIEFRCDFAVLPRNPKLIERLSA